MIGNTCITTSIEQVPADTIESCTLFTFSTDTPSGNYTLLQKYVLPTPSLPLLERTRYLYGENVTLSYVIQKTEKGHFQFLSYKKCKCTSFHSSVRSVCLLFFFYFITFTAVFSPGCKFIPQSLKNNIMI